MWFLALLCCAQYCRSRWHLFFSCDLWPKPKNKFDNFMANQKRRWQQRQQFINLGWAKERVIVYNSRSSARALTEATVPRHNRHIDNALSVLVNGVLVFPRVDFSWDCLQSRAKIMYVLHTIYCSVESFLFIRFRPCSSSAICSMSDLLKLIAD